MIGKEKSQVLDLPAAASLQTGYSTGVRFRHPCSKHNEFDLSHGKSPCERSFYTGQRQAFPGYQIQSITHTKIIASLLQFENERTDYGERQIINDILLKKTRGLHVERIDCRRQYEV